MENLPKDFFVTSQAFTKTTHRGVYPAIDPSSPALSQAGKVVVITGASRGLGANGFVPSFARANSKALVLVAGDVAKLKDVEASVKKINSSIEVLCVSADVSDEKSVAALFDQVKDKYGKADVLVNNAAVLKGLSPIRDVEPANWWADFEVNVKGTFLMTHHFLRLLGGTYPGTLIDLTTSAAFGVNPAISSYALSKLVAAQLPAFVAAENPSVAAFSLHPGIVKTDATMDVFLRFADDEPELVGGTAVWLATEKARWLSGRYISANWDVEELVQRKVEIEGSEVLKLAMGGRFGLDQST